MKKKHIAMWSCPRSRSTLMTRSFEQRRDCVIYDEPFYPPYLLTHGVEHPCRDDILSKRETNYKKIIKFITSDLPSNIAFSFQKHIAKNILPDFGSDWLQYLNSFFLIRTPKEVISSYLKINNTADSHDIGFIELYNIFLKVKEITGTIPVVVDSDDLLKDPKGILKQLLLRMDIEFNENMFNWNSGVKNSQILMGGDLENKANVWQSSLMNSTGFQPYTQKNIKLPYRYKALEDECLIIYDELYDLRLQSSRNT